MWNDDEGEWTLPAIKPRPGVSAIVKLPGIGRGGVGDVPALGGAYVTDDESVPRATSQMSGQEKEREKKGGSRRSAEVLLGGEMEGKRRGKGHKEKEGGAEGEAKKSKKKGENARRGEGDDNEDRARQLREGKEKEEDGPLASALLLSTGDAVNATTVTVDEEARHRVREAQRARLAARKEKQKAEAAAIDALLQGGDTPHASSGMEDGKTHKSRDKTRCGLSPLVFPVCVRALSHLVCACRRRRSTEGEGKEKRKGKEEKEKGAAPKTDMDEYDDEFADYIADAAHSLAGRQGRADKVRVSVCVAVLWGSSSYACMHGGVCV